MVVDANTQRGDDDDGYGGGEKGGDLQVRGGVVLGMMGWRRCW